MKARTYIKKILKDDACSIATAEKLDNALQREGIKIPGHIRFSPLRGLYLGDLTISESEKAGHMGRVFINFQSAAHLNAYLTGYGLE